MMCLYIAKKWVLEADIQMATYQFWLFQAPSGQSNFGKREFSVYQALKIALASSGSGKKLGPLFNFQKRYSEILC